VIGRSRVRNGYSCTQKSEHKLTSSLFEQVRAIASDLFDVAPEGITAESSPETVEKWDSVQHLSLVLAIEERFHCQLTPEEIEHMHNIGGVVRVLQGKLQSASG